MVTVALYSRTTVVVVKDELTDTSVTVLVASVYTGVIALA